jgi:hypothetical protein
MFLWPHISAAKKCPILVQWGAQMSYMTLSMELFKWKKRRVEEGRIEVMT